MNKSYPVWGWGVALLLAAMPAQAQRPGFGGPGFGGPGFGGSLVMMPEVQKELKLDQTQIELIQGVQESMDKKRQQLFGGGRGRPDGPGGQDRRAAFQKMRAETDRQVAEILEPKQLARLKQLEIQRAGIRALGERDVQEKLKLTAEQRQKIEQTLTGEREGMRSAFQGMSFDGGFSDEDRTKIREQMTALRMATERKLNTLLTEPQKKHFESLQGPKFAFPQRNFEFRGRPGGSRPGGRPPRPTA